METNVQNCNMHQTLKYCAISGIVTLVLGIPTGILEALKSMDRSSPTLVIAEMVLLLLSGISSALFIYGLIIVAKYFKLKLLHASAFAVLVFIVLLTSYAIVVNNNDQLRENVVLAVVPLVLFGVVSLVMSIAFLNGKDILGSPAKAVGVLGIIIGSSFITVILSFIGLILLIPYEIVSIIFLFRIRSKLKTQTSAS